MSDYYLVIRYLLEYCISGETRLINFLLQVDMEKLAGCLPLHLMACVASSGSEPRLRYWLRSVRLLHTLSTLAHDSPKLSQVCSSIGAPRK